MGAGSAPQLVYGFPGGVSTRVNDAAVHGLPDGRLIQAGDLVQLDVTFEKNGYMTDTAATIAVEPVTDQARRLDGLCRARAFPRGKRKRLDGARERRHLAAHFEQTIVMTDRAPLLLTA